MFEYNVAYMVMYIQRQLAWTADLYFVIPKWMYFECVFAYHLLFIYLIYIQVIFKYVNAILKVLSILFTRISMGQPIWQTE